MNTTFSKNILKKINELGLTRMIIPNKTDCYYICLKNINLFKSLINNYNFKLDIDNGIVLSYSQINNIYADLIKYKLNSKNYDF